LRPRVIAVLAALLTTAAALLLVAGCGTDGSISDPKIVNALDLKRAANKYEMGGDPFCTIDQLLNDADEVEEASKRGGDEFVIASRDGEIGVLARRPFAPDCSRRAKAGLQRLERQSG
jgi:hypothetical protein